MNSFANTILTLMLGWLRALLNAVLRFISSDSSTALFDFFSNNWQIIFLVLCVGGFALDKIVYLIRWRPSPIWLRRRIRRARRNPPKEAYELPDYDPGVPDLPTNGYTPAQGVPYASAAPTVQYRKQQQPGQQAFDAQSANPSYTAPPFAPVAAQGAYPTGEIPLRWDESSQGHTFAPAADRQQRFAFGMAPSFGSAQSEPAYNYHRDAMSGFAPPQYAQDYGPAETFAPPAAVSEPLRRGRAAQPPAYPEPGPNFRPFPERGADAYAPPKAKRLGAVARKARNLLNSDEAYQSLTYQDLQPAVDVTRAFHAPVFPEKKPEGDA
jgi:hypothetical protein